jgi:hypothetical protein
MSKGSSSKEFVIENKEESEKNDGRLSAKYDEKLTNYDLMDRTE